MRKFSSGSHRDPTIRGHTEGMGSVLKILLAALLTLPAAAYVAGALTADRASLEREHVPVVLDDPVVAEPEETLTSQPGDPRNPRKGPRDDTRDPDEVEVIGPQTTVLDAEGDDDGERDDDGDGGRQEHDDDRDADQELEEDADDDREEDRSGSNEGPEDDDERDDEADDDRSGSGGGDDAEESDDDSVDD